MTKLLLLASVLLIATAGLAQNAPAVLSAPVVDRNLMAMNAAPPDALPDLPGIHDRQRAMSPDDICYRIRAYIFRRDDDHAPKYVGSTTCGPRQPSERKVTSPGAHLELLK